jgi:hypothetical protein
MAIDLFSLYMFCFFPLSNTRLLRDYGCLIKQKVVTLREHLFFFVGTVLLIFFVGTVLLIFFVGTYCSSFLLGLYCSSFLLGPYYSSFWLSVLCFCFVCPCFVSCAQCCWCIWIIHSVTGLLSLLFSFFVLAYYVSLCSVLWCPLRFPHKNDVWFVFTSSCLQEGLCLIYVICVCLCLVVSNMQCFADHCLSFFFSLGHCIFCPSIYGFWLPLWYLRFTVSDYLFGILDLRFLTTSLVF